MLHRYKSLFGILLFVLGIAIAGFLTWQYLSPAEPVATPMPEIAAAQSPEPIPEASPDPEAEATPN
ncbi:MAG TPA: hypothetical protein VHR86_09535, partial [Armatimonadota bacterium]|nr:hypothetical protein [Armatimonadota bacterium]